MECCADSHLPRDAAAADTAAIVGNRYVNKHCKQEECNAVSEAFILWFSSFTSAHLAGRALTASAEILHTFCQYFRAGFKPAVLRVCMPRVILAGPGEACPACSASAQHANAQAAHSFRSPLMPPCLQHIAPCLCFCNLLLWENAGSCYDCMTAFGPCLMSWKTRSEPFSHTCCRIRDASRVFCGTGHHSLSNLK